MAVRKEADDLPEWKLGRRQHLAGETEAEARELGVTERCGRCANGIEPADRGERAQEQEGQGEAGELEDLGHDDRGRVDR